MPLERLKDYQSRCISVDDEQWRLTTPVGVPVSSGVIYSLLSFYLRTFLSLPSTWSVRVATMMGNGRNTSSKGHATVPPTGTVVLKKFLAAFWVVRPDSAASCVSGVVVPIVLDAWFDDSNSSCSILVLAAELDPGEGMWIKSSKPTSLSEPHSSAVMMTMSSLASRSSQDDSAASPTYVEFNVKSHYRPLACLSHVDTPRVCALGNPSRDVVHEARPDTSAN